MRLVSNQCAVSITMSIARCLDVQQNNKGPQVEHPRVGAELPNVASELSDYGALLAGIERSIFGHHKDEDSLHQAIKSQCTICREFDYPSPEEKKDRELASDRSGYYSVMHIFFSDSKLAVCVHSAQKHTRAFLYREQQYSTGSNDPWFQYLEDSSNVFYSTEVTWCQTDRLCCSGREQASYFNFRFGPSTDSLETWTLIQKWFRECTQSHEACSTPWKHMPYKPTRILELRYDQTPTCFRLVPGSQCPDGARYLTLSHCWGSQSPSMKLRLLKSTFNHLSEWQPVDILPKTFRDAVRVAKYFRVSYLWIDRLCIYQDSPEDWRREASSMQDVYRNSLLNVSALGATFDGDGLFFTRIPPQELYTTVNFRIIPEDGTKQFRARNSTDAPSLEGQGDWRETFWLGCFAREPLVRRAWVLQERLLAPRVLHFGKYQVFWECRQVQCCETNPITTMTYNERLSQEYREQTKGTGSASLWKRLLGTRPKRPQEPLHQLLSSWRDIVVQYSKCDLSVAGDKLIAVSGLAKQMRERLQELGVQRHRYLAGLWEEDFLQTLTWSLDCGEKGRRVSPYRAPSWSWASLDGVIRFPLTGDYDDCLFDAVLVGADTRFPSGGDDTGEVNGGSIMLNGSLATVRVGRMPDGSPAFIESLQWHNNDETVEQLSATDLSERAGMAQVLPSVAFDTDDDIADEVYQIIICAVRYTHILDNGKRDWYGLMLTKVEDNTYRRVGMIEYHDTVTIAAQELFKILPRKEIVII